MPWVPILPIFSIIFNAGLIVTLDLITWIRLIIWLAIGKFQVIAVPRKVILF